MKRDLIKIQMDSEGNTTLLFNSKIEMSEITKDIIRDKFDEIIDALEDDEELILP